MPLGNPLIECDSFDAANLRFPNTVLFFKFSRKTEEYLFEDINIYIEDIEHLGLSVEFVCRNESHPLNRNMQLVDDFMKQHDLKKIISHQVATLVGKKLL